MPDPDAIIEDVLALNVRPVVFVVFHIVVDVFARVIDDAPSVRVLVFE